MKLRMLLKRQGWGVSEPVNTKEDKATAVVSLELYAGENTR